ncbi:MAG: hypothetical protein DHS20C14_16160 [Phycisphaeraceae bacterium]|nr:MAG: hypothetical protein DHS20C14_16160 [Phycisphaeraceae bacterium]
MTTRSECLARAIEDTIPLIERYLAGFDDANRVRQAPGIANHAAWTLGHLAFIAARATGRIDGHDDPQPLPEDEFVMGDCTGGDATRFDTESVCVFSTPTDDAGHYPSWGRCLEIFASTHARLIASARGASDAQLDRPVAWGASSISAEQLGNRMVFHIGTHTGQLIDLRRAIGIPQIMSARPTNI